MNAEPTLLRATLALSLLGLLFFVIERGLGRGRVQPVFRRGWATDVIYGFFTILLTKPLVRLTLILPAALLILAQLTTPELLKLQAYRDYSPLSRQPVWLQTIQIYMLIDLIGY